MQAIWIIIAIVWIIIPIIAKNKKQQAQQQAARERAARQRAAAEAAAKRQDTAAQPIRTTPLAPRVHPSALQPAFEGTSSHEGTGSYEGTGSSEGVGSPEEGTAKYAITSKLRELDHSPQHVVSASSVSGHAHQETSMTGIRPDCPPDPVPTVTAVTPVAAQSSFLWDQTQVLNGIVLSEILSPCLSMRD